MKIYTRTGDSGETGLLGGIRVSKDHLVVRACGGLDEVNSQIGLVRSGELPKQVDECLAGIQPDLFVLGALLAECMSANPIRAAPLKASRVKELEQAIDRFDSELQPMDAFIMPGGCPSGAQIHVARTVCRRAERDIVELTKNIDGNTEIAGGLIYLNRLSDLLFVLARYVNHVNKSPETKWLPDS